MIVILAFVLIQEGLTALMLATQRGHKEVIKVLVERKANPNITEVVGLCLYVWIMYHCSLYMYLQTTGWTALHFSAEVGDVETLRILLEGGANVDIKNKVSGLIFLGFIMTVPDISEWINSS